ncbi:hypothetical protein DF200_08645 [Bifidobacterium catulorum]|uniref:Uncharacterized protein n=1 Tax=Bifidobacterium catulorum TaxID=1630173 RepID=A0A2U2MQZ2_9BIFI|nr:hypothetical protein DF200_08645 [Bifidobacterium catulorum]
MVWHVGGDLRYGDETQTRGPVRERDRKSVAGVIGMIGFVGMAGVAGVVVEQCGDDVRRMEHLTLPDAVERWMADMRG